ncbi:phosphoadenylyl-sulfate reductase (thioredoxin) [Aliidongia dinghuensis]|uniref:Adenosine 5'-phosphosulfate reductase n=1 Tax=Aliidongia dinghuensis TaxID=1867774 RepID=A0A8J3E5B8_9PROT|nr:phosphoadenylyl-sulfate reductase [Aliidongia dinghuensis]GGF34146.1 phosphoadenylyl-sulfate reductase (thioredoxin) [Aliidongia dinghuensis]
MDLDLAARQRAVTLNRQYQGVDGEEFLRAIIEDEFPGRVAIVSSFGTESALLLALAARVRQDIPIIFLDTGHHFPETLAYRDLVQRRLGLTGLRTVKAADATLADRDPDAELWQFDTDACCSLRKVEPLQHAIREFDVLISGRKHYHGALRQFISRAEAVDGLIKVDPIADWSPERVEEAFEALDLPRHPLIARGYRSVGCRPCTIPAGDAADPRAGRWAGQVRTECGIHRAGRLQPAQPAETDALSVAS